MFATHRVLVTLNEARRRRRTLNTLIGQREDIGIHALDQALGPRMTPALREARDKDCAHAARALSREVAVNRRILRRSPRLWRRRRAHARRRMSNDEWLKVIGGPRRDEP